MVYTPNEEGMQQSLIPAFEENTGGRSSSSPPALASSIRAYAATGNPQGDVMFGGGAAQAAVNAELWQNYVSPEDAAMVEAGKNTTGAFTPIRPIRDPTA